MDRQSRHCKNDHLTKRYLQVQYNCNKNTDIFTETEKYSEIHVDPQKTKDSQRNTEQNNKFGGITTSAFKTTLQS